MSDSPALARDPLGFRVRAIVALALARECVRACAVPFRALAFLMFRARWRASIAEAVREGAHDAPEDCALQPERLRELAARSVFLSAAEPSGDHHAAELAHELARLAPGVKIRGFGGPELARAGVELLADTTARAAMGFSGVLRLLPAILREVGLFVRCLERERPAIVALVDAPAYHLVLARLARRAGIPVFYYVCPQVWGWAPWRLGRLRRAVDRCGAIFPFEPRWFARHGIRAHYVGHPRVEHWAKVPLPDAPSESSARSDGLRIALLPGSRGSDLKVQLPAFLRIARALYSARADLAFEILQSSPRHAELIERLSREIAPELRCRVVFGDLRATLRGCELALVKSGTGSFDVALACVPSIVLYRLDARFERILRRCLLTAPAIAQANLFEPGIVPELVLETAADEARAAEIARAWLADGSRELHERRVRLEALRARLDDGAARRAAGWLAATVVMRSP